jgi:uncharacterized membrane protein
MNTPITKNAVLMAEARKSLAGKWGLAVGTTAVYLAISIALSGAKGFGPVVSLLVSGPLMLGLTLFSLSLSRNTPARLEQLFDGFKKYSVSLAAYLLMLLFTVLWTLLLIVPGIIAAISYSQTFFLLADDDTLGARAAIEKSKKMMQGYKWRYFCLGLRFIGWGLLSLLTLGVGFLWLLPYMQVSKAKFYDALRGADAVVQ